METLVRIYGSVQFALALLKCVLGADIVVFLHGEYIKSFCLIHYGVLKRI